MIYGFIRKSTLKSVIIHACMDFMPDYSADRLAERIYCQYNYDKKSLLDLISGVLNKKLANELINDDLDISRMFDEFYTLDISRTKGNTGLGLAIVKEFVNQLNCEIISKKIENKLCLTIEFN